MGTTAAKLQGILNSKNAIKTSLINKGVNITDNTPFSDYSTEIDNMSVPTTLKGVLDLTKTADSLFRGLEFTKNLDGIIAYEDTSNVTNMSNMFRECYELTTIPALDTSNVTNMSTMFRECYELTTIPALDTSNVINVNEMFRDCYELTTIPALDTSNVTNMSNMFRNCYKLTKIVLTNMSAIPSYSSTLLNCYHFTGTQQTVYNPNGLKDGYIYVPDDKVSSMQVATGWTQFATQIKGLSELSEE